MYDGDGCFYIRNNTTMQSSYNSSSFHLINGLFNFLKKELKIKTKSKIYKDKRGCYSFCLSHSDSIELMRYLYKPVINKETDLFLERKFNKVAPYII